MRHWEEISLKIHRFYCSHTQTHTPRQQHHHLSLHQSHGDTRLWFYRHFKRCDLDNHEVDATWRKMTNKNKQDCALKTRGTIVGHYGCRRYVLMCAVVENVHLR